MILGLGSDLVDIRRIQRVLTRYGERFTHRLFTDDERAHADSMSYRAASYAKRFAAKEACAKALGIGIRGGVSWRDISVVNDPGGMPSLVLTGGAERRLQSMVPEGVVPHIALSLSDEPPFAQAVVVISAVRGA